MHELRGQRLRQKRVLSVRLGHAAPAHVARNVDDGRPAHQIRVVEAASVVAAPMCVAQRDRLRRRHVADGTQERRIPRGCEPDRLREGGDRAVRKVLVAAGVGMAAVLVDVVSAVQALVAAHALHGAVELRAAQPLDDEGAAGEERGLLADVEPADEVPGSRVVGERRVAEGEERDGRTREHRQLSLREHGQDD